MKQCNNPIITEKFFLKLNIAQKDDSGHDVIRTLIACIMYMLQKVIDQLGKSQQGTLYMFTH